MTQEKEEEESRIILLYFKKRVIAGIKPSPFGFEGQHYGTYKNNRMTIPSFIHSFIHYADNSIKFSGSKAVSSKMITFLIN